MKTKKVYQTKKRIWKAKKINFCILMAFIAAGCIAIGINSKYTENVIESNLTPIQAQTPEKTQNLSVEEEVLGLVREAGLNEYEAWAIIQCESRWKADAVNVNRNGTYDLGLWQVNSIHKDINNTDKLNYIKATKWAIAKRLRDGNWNAWSCAK